MQANELTCGDLFIEKTDTSYVWEFKSFHDSEDEVIAERILVRLPKVGGYNWRTINGNPEQMNPYTTVQLLSI